MEGIREHEAYAKLPSRSRNRFSKTVLIFGRTVLHEAAWRNPKRLSQPVRAGAPTHDRHMANGACGVCVATRITACRAEWHCHAKRLSIGSTRNGCLTALRHLHATAVRRLVVHPCHAVRPDEHYIFPTFQLAGTHHLTATLTEFSFWNRVFTTRYIFTSAPCLWGPYQQHPDDSTHPPQWIPRTQTSSTAPRPSMPNISASTFGRATRARHHPLTPVSLHCRCPPPAIATATSQTANPAPPPT